MSRVSCAGAAGADRGGGGTEQPEVVLADAGYCQPMIEPVFGQTKFNRRIDRFHRHAARTEWRLVTATHNLLKLWRLTTAPTPA
jgi:hypothetical protein